MVVVIIMVIIMVIVDEVGQHCGHGAWQ